MAAAPYLSAPGEDKIAASRASRSRRTTRHELALTLLVSAFTLSLPLLTRNDFQETVAKNLLITLIVTLGFSLLYGFTGQLSLAHAAFYAIGAYAPPILMNRLALPWPLAIAVALCCVAVIALVVGAPTLRLTGFYLAVATLALATLTDTVLNQWFDLTGGPLGINNIAPLSVGGFPLRGKAYFWLVVVVALGVYFFLSNVVRSRVGRALRAIKDNEVAAAATGVNVAFYKSLAFVLSALVAGLAGTLYAFNLLYVSPYLGSLDNAILWVFMVKVGGLGSFPGTILGTTVLYLVPEVFSFLNEYQVLVVGLVLIVVMLFAPGGMISLVHRLTGRWWSEDRQDAPPLTRRGAATTSD